MMHFDQHLHRFFFIEKPYVRRFSIFLYGKKKKLISLTHNKLKRMNLFRSLNNQIDSPHSVLQITSYKILFSTYKFDEMIEFNRKIRKISRYVDPDLADTPRRRLSACGAGAAADFLIIHYYKL